MQTLPAWIRKEENQVFTPFPGQDTAAFYTHWIEQAYIPNLL
jgi:hypothetical protein